MGYAGNSSDSDTAHTRYVGALPPMAIRAAVDDRHHTAEWAGSLAKHNLSCGGKRSQSSSYQKYHDKVPHDRLLFGRQRSPRTPVQTATKVPIILVNLGAPVQPIVPSSVVAPTHPSPWPHEFVSAWQPQRPTEDDRARLGARPDPTHRDSR